jgi:hypothetical protein
MIERDSLSAEDVQHVLHARNRPGARDQRWGQQTRALRRGRVAELHREAVRPDRPAERSTSSRERASSRPLMPPNTSKPCTRRAWSPAGARGPTSATRSPARKSCRCGLRCATRRSSASRRRSGPHVTTWAGTSTHRTRGAGRPPAQGRRRPHRRAPGRGIPGRSHRGRALDPARGARGPAGGAAGRSRDRRLLPRALLRPTRTRRSGACEPRGDRRGGSRRVGPNAPLALRHVGDHAQWSTAPHRDPRVGWVSGRACRPPSSPTGAAS